MGTSWLNLYEPTTDYMSAHDIDASTGDRTLTIDRVNPEIVEGEKGPQQRGIIYWKEDVKPLIVNKTNSLLLGALFDDIEGSIGKRVTIWWDATVKVSGKAVGGLRIKGSPDISRGVSVEIKLKNRKAKTHRLTVTKMEEAVSGEALLRNAATDAGITVEDVGAWLKAVHGADLASLGDDDLRRLATNDVPLVVAWKSEA